MDEHQERVIAQGLRAGRPEAWQALYEAYAARVWRCVARLLGPSSADVGDVVQETMMAAARSAATFDPERGSLWFWLWGIGRRHVALHFRKQERHNRLRQACQWLAASNGRLQRWLDGQEPSPPAELLAAELATLVRATLAELPQDYEVMLTAKYIDGETIEAIASRERSSESAIRSKLARARQSFRRAFGKYAESTLDQPNEAHHDAT
jgi:RNA polymerase sigma-70 factor (ECF subfamily)